MFVNNFVLHSKRGVYLLIAFYCSVTDIVNASFSNTNL